MNPAAAVRSRSPIRSIALNCLVGRPSGKAIGGKGVPQPKRVWGERGCAQEYVRWDLAKDQYGPL